MTIRQLSIFIENKEGTLVRVLDMLKEGGFQILASTLADTQEFGIYRVLCTDTTRAYLMLREAGINVQLSEVFALMVNDEPGMAARAIRELTVSGVNIRYMYTFLLGGKGVLIFRADPADKAREVIMLNKLHFATEEDLDALINGAL